MKMQHCPWRQGIWSRCWVRSGSRPWTSRRGTAIRLISTPHASSMDPPPGSPTKHRAGPSCSAADPNAAPIGPSTSLLWHVCKSGRAPARALRMWNTAANTPSCQRKPLRTLAATPIPIRTQSCQQCDATGSRGAGPMGGGSAQPAALHCRANGDAWHHARGGRAAAGGHSRRAQRAAGAQRRRHDGFQCHSGVGSPTGTASPLPSPDVQQGLRRRVVPLLARRAR